MYVQFQVDTILIYTTTVLKTGIHQTKDNIIAHERSEHQQ